MIPVQQTFDWGKMYQSVKQMIVSLTGMTVIQDSTISKTPAFPFITINPSGSITHELASNNPTNEPFTTTLSITVHSDSKLVALQTMDDLQANLREEENHYQLQQQGIVIVDVLNPGSRFTALSVGYEYTYGFDLNIRLGRSFTSSTPIISDVTNDNGKLNI